MSASEPSGFSGIHVIGEMYGIEYKVLEDKVLLEKALILSVNESGAQVCSCQSKKIKPSGVAVLILLEESHASLHSNPSSGALFFDAFTYGSTCRPELIAKKLSEILKPKRFELRSISRGEAENDAIKKISPSFEIQTGQQSELKRL